MQFSREFKGIFLASISATFWGVSGAVAQTLFDTTDINSIWLTGIRMLGAGIALFLVSLVTHVDLWSIWRQPRDLLHRSLHVARADASTVHVFLGGRSE
uniref:EamA family transporter n=1 Tax=Lactiplantibacillus pentosus TaxID=1589 RepID=UPI0020A7E4F5|nr:EamA family transporter [Lactiplantibacillus pentosus]